MKKLIFLILAFAGLTAQAVWQLVEETLPPASP